MQLKDLCFLSYQQSLGCFMKLEIVPEVQKKWT